MRAISLWQPWATLIAIGAKTHETRSWATEYRGPIAIHASKRAEWWDQARLMIEEPFRLVLNAAGIYFWSDLPLGDIVAVANLDKCIHIANGWRPKVPAAPYEVSFGDYREGRYAWDLHAIRPLKEPIPCRGYQGLWIVPPDVEAEIRRQLGESVRV